MTSESFNNSSQVSLNERISTLNSDTSNRRNYSKEIFDCINEIRKSPINMIGKLDYVSAFIVSKDTGQQILSYGNSIRISLIRGIPKFNETKRLLLDRKPVKPLIYNEELTIDIPEDPALWVDHKTVVELVQKKQKELVSKYDFFGFHYDYGAADPMISSVLMLVDDNKCNDRRRENILNPNFSQIGISHKGHRKRFCSYFVFVG